METEYFEEARHAIHATVEVYSHWDLRPCTMKFSLVVTAGN